MQRNDSLNGMKTRWRYRFGMPVDHMGGSEVLVAGCFGFDSYNQTIEEETSAPLRSCEGGTQ